MTVATERLEFQCPGPVVLLGSGETSQVMGPVYETLLRGAPVAGSLIWHALTARHLLEGTTVLAGAAMIAAGAQALPVYEICKVGEDPRWIPPAVNDGVRAYAVEVKFQENLHR